MVKLLLIFDISVDGYKNIDLFLIQRIEKFSIGSSGQPDLRHGPTSMGFEQISKTLGQALIQNDDHELRRFFILFFDGDFGTQ